jgi:putative flippase GtrA
MSEMRAFARKHAKRLIKFATVGFFGVIVNAIIYTMLINVDFLNFPIFYENITLSWGIGIIAAFIFNYFVNTFWTYRDAMKSLDDAPSNSKSK